jgi:RNA 3'-terminal phosphate cyclase-like protein
MIAPFCKKPLNLTLQGITTDDKDLSVSVAKCDTGNRSHAHREKVDMIRTVTLPHLELFGISDGLELRVSAEFF